MQEARRGLRLSVVMAVRGNYLRLKLLLEVVAVVVVERLMLEEVVGAAHS